MKMKTTMWTAALAMVLGLFTAGCSDDSGSGPDVKKSCSDVCTKQVSCGQIHDQASCESDCHAMLPKWRDDFARATTDCVVSHSCTELDNGACQSVGQNYCTTDIRPFFEGICTQDVNCQGGTQSDIDDCVTRNLSNGWSDFFKCYKKSALDDYVRCHKDLGCNFTEEQDDACWESALGIPATD